MAGKQMGQTGTPIGVQQIAGIVGFHPSFSRHGRAQTSLVLLMWLNENVTLCSDFLRNS